MKYSWLCLFLAFAAIACNRTPEPPPAEETWQVSYRLTEGSRLLKSRSEKVPAPNWDDQDPLKVFSDELKEASGTLVLETYITSKNGFEVEVEIRDGREEGLLRSYGVMEGRRFLSLEQFFVKGVRHGHNRAYYPDGGLTYEGDWFEGKKSGVWRIYYRGSRQAFVGTLLEDRFEGALDVYDANGMIIAKGVYKKGRPWEGSFVENPWRLMAPGSYYDSSMGTWLLHFKKGVETGREEIAVEIAKD